MDDAPLPDASAATTVTDGDPRVGLDTAGAPDQRSPWRWVPSLYFAEALPYMAVMALAVILYKRMGMTNTDIALYTSWLYLPWVIKPFWSPLVDVLKTKRLWILATQVLIGGGLAGVAFTLPTAAWVQGTLAFFWLLAFASATHDIAADGFYMLALDEHDQAWYVGIRSTFYRAAIIAVSGLVPMLAGALESSTGLGAVDVEVRAVPAGAGDSLAQATELPLAATDRTSGADAERGDLTLSASADDLAIPLALRPTDETAALIAQAREANTAAGFYPVDEGPAASDDGPSWFGRTISGPLGAALEAAFGTEREAASDVAGNVGVVAFRLSGPPPAGEEVAVNLGIEDGDQSLKLVEGGQRFTFNEANWDRPFLAVVQLDRSLDAPTAATFRATSGNIPLAWSITFFVLAGVFLLIMAWHTVALPRPAVDVPNADGAGGGSGILQYLAFLALFIPTLLVLLIPMMIAGLVAPRTTGPWGRMFRALPFSGSPFAETITSFFKKPEVGIAVAFVLFYRFAEAQLVKLAAPFLLDSVEAGGLALTTGEVGFVYGTVGALCLTIGGVLGGILAARDGIGKWLWPMVLAINLPNAVYLFLAVVRPDNFLVINAAIALEQFGYGFGFAAFLLVLIYVADGEHKTAHYAIGTGLMALGMMIPGMFSGWLEDIIGYQSFFLWVLIATIPSFLVTARIKIDPTFGQKKEEPAAA
ncbi:MFS transporter [Rubrivirga sp. IMCC43871]|uniref:MFS transporter n=1 Tax=Rubrivirga sp. IMCC43871 TaxID=3391575 RepID=UPI00398FA703